MQNRHPKKRIFVGLIFLSIIMTFIEDKQEKISLSEDNLMKASVASANYNKNEFFLTVVLTLMYCFLQIPNEVWILTFYLCNKNVK